MRVEVLHVDGCPNHRPVVNWLREALRDHSLIAEIEEVRVCDPETARERGFRGSPTVRINAADIDPAGGVPAEFGLTCRTGLPSREVIDRALEAATE